MVKTLLLCVAAALCGGAMAYAQSPAKTLKYYDGLMEYYAGYCDAIGPKEWEETYMVMYPEKYVLNEKDARKRQTDIDEVRTTLKQVVSATRKGTHAYTVLLRGELGAYDSTAGGLFCRVIAPQGFVGLSPSEKNTVDASGSSAGQSTVALGVLFGKISTIKLLFINADEFCLLPFAADKAAALLAGRTDAIGNINKEIYAVLTIEILPRAACRRAWDGVMRNIYTPGTEKNYFIIGRIKRVDIYADPQMSQPLGRIKNTILYDPQ